MIADFNELSKASLFDLIGVPPKKDSDEWDDDHISVYKMVTEERNMDEMGMCIEEAERYSNVTLVFCVPNRKMESRLLELARRSEGHKWKVMLVEV